MHGLIVGTTLSGKSTLARKIAKQAAHNGRNVIVLDSNLDYQWKQNGAEILTDLPEFFIDLSHQNENCQLIVDEAGEYCNRYASDMHWLATRARHKGHKSLFISQRPTTISPNIRANCATIFAFSMNYDDAKEFSKDFNCKEILQAVDLPVGECIYYKRHQKPQRIKVF